MRCLWTTCQRGKPLTLVGHRDAGVTVEPHVVQESGEALVQPIGVWVPCPAATVL
jgi:hypothetical protein